MPQPANFLDAHGRHWQDAELLFHAHRWANADQLYGFSAECDLKAVMEVLGMETDPAGTPRAREHRRHVQHLWPKFLAFAEERGGTRLAGLTRKTRRLPTGRRRTATPMAGTARKASCACTGRLRRP